MTLPDTHILRRIQADDYSRGALTTLAALTKVGTISDLDFASLVAHWDKTFLRDGQRHIYNTLVIVDTTTNSIVALGSIVLEEKLIHGLGVVGHIEDIAVAEGQQGKKLGWHLITALVELGKKAGTYKIILDCDKKNVGFYEKCGFNIAGVEMQIRFDK